MGDAFERFFNRPVSRRDVVVGGTIAAWTSVVAGAFPKIWEALKKNYEKDQDSHGIENAIHSEIQLSYSKFIEDHGADFWDGKEGFNLMRYQISTAFSKEKPNEIRIGLVDVFVTQNFGVGTYETLPPPIASFTYTMQKGSPYDYKRDFKEPLFEALKDKLPQT